MMIAFDKVYIRKMNFKLMFCIYEQEFVFGVFDVMTIPDFSHIQRQH